MNDYEKPEVTINDLGGTDNGPGTDDMGETSNILKDDIWT